MEPLSKISLRDKFASFSELWQPKIIALVDDFAIKIVKLDGEFVWHHHAEADEVFFVIAGGIRMKYRVLGNEMKFHSVRANFYAFPEVSNICRSRRPALS